MRPRVPAVVVLVALSIASVPLAAGNAPPVAVAQAQAEAVMGEPIVFSSASHDPDGTIVSTRWEFSDDGRTYLGTSVTRALLFAGIHRIVLTVTDDAGAATSVELQVLVHAPLMSGRATALRVTDQAFADTGAVSTTQNDRVGASDGEVRNGQLRVARMASEVQTVADAQGPRTAARADVGYVYIPVPIGYILATGVEAESIVGCTFPTILHAKVTQLRLNDAPLVPPGEVPPNTVLAVPGVGTLTLNAQEATAGGGIAVTALRLTTAQGVVEVARAEAGVEHCPYAS